MSDVGGITHDEKDDVAPLRHPARGIREVGSEIEQRSGLRRSPIEYGEGVAGGNEMRRHVASHDAGADPSDPGARRRNRGEGRDAGRHGSMEKGGGGGISEPGEGD